MVAAQVVGRPEIIHRAGQLLEEDAVGLVEREARGTRNCYTLREDRLRSLGAATSGLFAGLISEISAPAARIAEPA